MHIQDSQPPRGNAFSPRHSSLSLDKVFLAFIGSASISLASLIPPTKLNSPLSAMHVLLGVLSPSPLVLILRPYPTSILFVSHLPWYPPQPTVIAPAPEPAGARAILHLFVKALGKSGYLTSFAQRLDKGESFVILPPTCLQSLPPPDLKGQIFGEDIDIGTIVALLILVESLWHPAQDLKNNDTKAELAVMCEEDNNMDYFSATDELGEDSGIDDQDAWVVREDTDDQDAHATADRDLNHDSNNTDDSVDGGLVSTHRLDTAGLFLQAGAVAGLPSVYLSPSTPAGPCFKGASPSEIPSSADSTSDEC
ncbi:hypothetical protein FISHEDRAFT_73564 [Fistulina hepatica ATCC 64428]|uniref:Uncharacterized protein n=1 Tax=Fistulina hepatica ATCC 64428 TaxID=1128425 RepID=A0A0D7AD36_9AGAR|nr:hypothetical protein FISHEDRAFT_73564 [Fistulina hepatica ATCC 64428]